MNILLSPSDDFMRFLVEYLDAKTNVSNRDTISLLSSFLNYHLIGKFHGWSYECLFIKLVSNAPPKRKWKLTRTYDQWGNIELPLICSHPENVTEEINTCFNKVIEAIDLIDKVEIKGKDFRCSQLKSDLLKLQSYLPKSVVDYQKLFDEKSVMDSFFQLRRVDGYINACKENPLPHSRRLVGARIYDHFDTSELMPYRYMYSEIFSTLLRNRSISTPGYREIYFAIDETLEKAKTNLALEKWHKYTYCSIDIERYRKAPVEEKEQLLLNSLVEGLRLIADFDHLDKEKIESVITTVNKTKCKTPLTYATKENNRYRVEIHYEMVPDHTQKIPFFITISNKTTGKQLVKLIDNFSTFWVPYSIAKVKILKDRVEISGGGGVRGDVSRDIDHMPDKYEFYLMGI